MASRPWCPLPSGSKAEGPIGSCTTASGAKRFSQVSRSPACTAARERIANSRALSVSSVMSAHSLPRRASCPARTSWPERPGPSTDLGDHVVAEALQGIDLGLQRLGVLLGDVGPAEADNHIG